MKYSVEISAVKDGVYIPNSDIQLGLCLTKEEAREMASKVCFQDDSKYELYIYTLDDGFNIIETERIV